MSVTVTQLTMAAGAGTMPSTTTTTTTSSAPSLSHRPSISISSPSRPSGPPSLCHRILHFLLFRVLALILTTSPCLYLIDFFSSSPYTCYCTIVTICVGLCLSMWGQKIMGVPLIATALIVGGYNMGLIPIYTFTAIIGFFAVILCIGLAFFSVLIGSRRSPRVQELCMLVGAGAPVVFSIIYVCIADFTLFRMGLTLSVISSFINIFFNKLSASVGVPLKHSMVRPSENNLAAAWGNSFTHTAQAQ